MNKLFVQKILREKYGGPMSQYRERLIKTIDDKYPWLLENKEDIEQLLNNMEELERYGLRKLNENLLRKDFFPILTEHNIALELIRKHEENFQIEYEPKDMEKPVDFRISHGTYCSCFNLQVRRLGDPQEDIQTENLIKELQQQFKNIKKSAWIHLSISREFSAKHINPFVKYIKQVSKSLDFNAEYYFPDEDSPLLSFNFSEAKKPLEHLKIFSRGYFSFRKIGDRHWKRIDNTIKDAYKAFKSINDKEAINLILLEVTNGSMIQNEEIKEFCDAIFRKGLRNKLSGLIILRRPNGNLCSSYQKQLIINPPYSQNKSNINSLFKV